MRDDNGLLGATRGVSLLDNVGRDSLEDAFRRHWRLFDVFLVNISRQAKMNIFFVKLFIFRKYGSGHQASIVSDRSGVFHLKCFSEQTFFTV